ncbi:Fis family transcriptional regulator, factor for inversion stimulation protein [Alcanivorax sp. DSM 26293]|jgi:Fis family transcriptional regulator|nr:Fis family transcriptional regulator, factor for inversion stimulation protein [Alcanivorax sp. DSM 26293]|tara:strand:- start:381 stop:710 length:330 start_codon:yes stop_codon:yes gene_type:complete
MTLSSVNTAAARTLTEMNTAEARKPHLTIARSETHDTLRNCVRRSLNDYFNQLDGEPVSELYQMVLAEMEIPLLEKVLEYTRGNQTKAAELLGLNRGTLRKKLKQYGLL